MSYAQSLWQQIYHDGTDLKVTDNGIVEAAYTVISMTIKIILLLKLVHQTFHVTYYYHLFGN